MPRTASRTVLSNLSPRTVVAGTFGPRAADPRAAELTVADDAAVRPGPHPGRLRSGAEIQAVFRRGASAHSPYLSVHCLHRGGRGSRVAVVAGRGVGGAVQRNRAKRRLRAALRDVEVPGGVDLVVVARDRAVRGAYVDVRAALAERLRTCSRKAQHARATRRSQTP